MLYRCMNCGCDVGGIMAASRVACDGCPVCGCTDVDSLMDGQPAPTTQEMPAVWIDPDDADIPF